MHASKHERGQVMLIVLLTLLPLCLIVGLVVDLGMIYYTKTSARTAAQTAALAAIQSALDGISHGGTYTCGSQGLGCQTTPAACPGTGNLQKGCLYATANGFTNVAGGSPSVLFDGNTGAPPVPNVTNANYWVRVQIIQKNWLTFGAVTGNPSLNVVGSAVAAAVNMMPLKHCCAESERPRRSGSDWERHTYDDRLRGRCEFKLVNCIICQRKHNPERVIDQRRGRSEYGRHNGESYADDGRYSGSRPIGRCSGPDRTFRM